MSPQSGLLHTWSHLHKTMKASLQRLLASDSWDASKLQHLHLPLFFGRITDRGVHIGSALKLRFMAKYDDRLPLVIRADAGPLRLAVSLMLDYAMDRHPGVGYTTFAAHLAEEDDRDYVSFAVWHSGVSRDGDHGMRSWFSRRKMDEFAAHMGGFFLAKDQHGAEARYALRIPLISGDPSQAAQASGGAKAAGRVYAEDGVAALVVDDSAISRALGAHMLSWHNIAADAAESGAAALQKLNAKRYDLIFMGHSLPKLNKIQSAAMLRKKAPLQTGFIIGMAPGAGSAENMKDAFLRAGMWGFLDKPVDPRELNLLLLEVLPRVYEQNAEAAEKVPGGAAPSPQRDADRLGPSRTRRDTGRTAVPMGSDTRKSLTGAQKILARELSGIPGLDAEKGLANAGGNVEIYAGMLRRFTAELDDYIDPLLARPGSEAWEEALVRLQVLREFFAGIGAEELARDAAGLAAGAMAASGDPDWLPRIRSYCDAMIRLRAGLAGLNAGKRRESVVKRRVREGPRAALADMAKLQHCLSRLHDACLGHRAAEAREMADDLRRMALRDDMEDDAAAVCALVDSLDYPEARELCARLLKKIRPHRFGAAEENG